MTKVTKAVLTERAQAISAAMIAKLDEKSATEKTSNNRAKIEKHRKFFEFNGDALELLAIDNADTTYIAKQLYAIDKMVDFVKVATNGHLNHNFNSSMHVFMLRAILTLHNLKHAGKTIQDARLVVQRCMNGELAAKVSDDEKPLYYFGKVGYSSEATQSTQVVNVLRTLRILDESKSDLNERINLNTAIVKKVLAVLLDDKTDLAFLKP